MSSPLTRWLRRAAILGVFPLLVPSLAHASLSLTATLPTFPAPYSNAASLAMQSSVSVLVTNSGTQAAHRITFRLPTTSYSNPGGTAPTGWTLTTYSSGGYYFVEFNSVCGNAGLAASGGSATFVVSFLTPDASVPADATTSPFQVTGDTVGCSTETTTTTTFTAPVKALYVTGVAAPANGLGPTMTGVVTWTVTNYSNATQSGITVAPVLSPTAGISGSCTTLSTLGAGTGGTITCTYSITASGTYSFATSASNATGTATAVGASAGSIAVGSSSVTWGKYVIAHGRTSTYSLALTVKNVSGTSITRVDVTNASSTGWTLSSATSSNTGFVYRSGLSTAGDLVFTGTLANGASTTLTLNYSAVPAVTTTTTYPFGVTLRPSQGATYAMSTTQNVVLVVPISDVAGLTIQANSSGQTLAWTNTSANGSTHDGVVIFRATPPAVPASPTDFTTYTAGSGGVVYADGGGSTVQTFADATVGSYNYRVCNHDAYYVYSACNSGFWNGVGWLDSESYPTGGWVDAVGGSALLRPGYLTGGLLGLANNAPSVAVVNIATGARAFAPVSVPSLPTAYTPVFLLSNGKSILYAADQSGVITAVDVSTGLIYWQTTKTGQSFTAGVSGITRWSASAAYQAAYTQDILLIGSTTGTIFAIDCNTGNTLWTIAAGAGIYSLITYDPLTNVFWVPTSGAGVKAYTIVGSSPTVAAPPVSTWTNPEPTGSYRVLCVRTASSVYVACVDTSGVLRVMNKTTGAVQASFSTGISSPSGLARVSGSAATSGLTVSSASTVQVFTGTGTPYALARVGTWTPGVTISTPAILADNGYLVAGGSDRRLHKVSLASAAQTSQSAQVSTQASSLNLGQPILDTASGLIVFGTSDGHMWAIPSTSF